MRDRHKGLYLFLVFFVVLVCSIGSTYAYLAAVTGSNDAVLNTSSTNYSISMNVVPVYDGFSFIPMDNNNVLRALRDEFGCKDKYGRGACLAYRISLYGYDDNINVLSGSMDVHLNHITNLSYMVLQEVSEDAYDEDNCVSVKDNLYCIAKDATSVNEGKSLSLGNEYDITGTTEKNFLLVLWLSNLEESQNEYDIGSFDATVTFGMGSGGEIKGSIVAAIKSEVDGEEEDSMNKG